MSRSIRFLLGAATAIVAMAREKTVVRRIFVQCGLSRICKLIFSPLSLNSSTPEPFLDLQPTVWALLLYIHKFSNKVSEKDRQRRRTFGQVDGVGF